MDARPLVVDVDAHYYEDPRSFARYLDEPWRTRIASWTGRFFAPPAARSLSTDPSVGGRIHHGGGQTPASRDQVLEVMRFLGVDVTVLLPGTMLGIGEVTDRGRAVALCNGYADQMLNEVVDPERGVYAAVVAPGQSPFDAAELIDRVAGHDGVCAVAMMSDGPVLPLGHPFYDPIYDACQRAGLPLIVHSGYGGPEGRESGFGLETYAENHLAFVLNNQIQLCSMVLQGIPERFPRLRLIFQEAGVFWIPLMMFRLDAEYARTRSQLPLLHKPPSEYILDFHFGSQPLEVVPKQRYLENVFEMFNARERLLFATDWPHSDFDSPEAIRRLSFIDEQARANILGDNARRVLRFRGLGRLTGAGIGTDVGAEGGARRDVHDTGSRTGSRPDGASRGGPPRGG